MKGIIVVNGKYVSLDYTYQIARLVEEFGKRGETLEVRKNLGGFVVGESFSDIDYCLFFDKDVALARAMEAAGIAVFNNSFAIEKCDSKISTAQCLAGCDGIYMPKTLVSPLFYKQYENTELVDRAEREIGYPMVAKRATDSFGEGVFLINDREELEAKEFELSATPHLYQTFVEESKGQSVRAFVIGQKVVASMLLTNENDFRSNYKQGGRAVAVDIDENYRRSAVGIAERIQLDYCAVDFAVGAELVFEVNSNAFFTEIERVTKKNIAGIYAEYILDIMKEITEKK